jgi:hypothetical protein
LKTHFIIIIVALATMMGCAKRPPVVDFEKDFLQEKAKYEPNIGKTYWLLGGRFLCPTSTTNVIHCTSIDAGTKLQLDGIDRGVTSDAFYHVKLEDGRTGYISAFELLIYATDVDPMQAAAECIRRGDPRVGMSRKQLEATCWGKPERVDRRETARGLTERYVYSDTRSVLLHNGVVTSIRIRDARRN